MEYFNKIIIDAAIGHAQVEYPNESCGIIVDDKYIPLENTAENTKEFFRIDPVAIAYYYNSGQIQAIIHSHVDDIMINELGKKRVVSRKYASKEDMLYQIEHSIPYGIINLSHTGGYITNFFFGDQLEPAPLVGREFIHGVYDCYNIVRDYYRMEGITLNQYPRNFRWHTEINLIEDNIKDAGFEIVSKDYPVKKGDVILMAMRSKVINHMGLYMGDGTMIHHLYGRLSVRAPVSNFMEGSVTRMAIFKGATTNA